MNGAPTVELRKIRRNTVGGETFDSFDVWIDRRFHCSTRYSDFEILSERLTMDFPSIFLPSFPPKKMNLGFFSLKNEELETRRLQLQTYLTAVFEDPTLCNSSLLRKFLYLQREQFLESHAKEVEESIYSADNTSVALKFKTSIRTDDLLKLVCASLEILSSHFSDFSLFEVHDDPSRPEIRLASYAHPWLSCRDLEITSPGLEKKNFMYDEMLESDHKPTAKIFIKKWIFSPQRLPGLFRDPPALKILFAQAQADVKSHLIFPTGDEKAALRKMALEGSTKEYMQMVQNCRGYGITYMAPCKTNHPTEGSEGMLGIGLHGLELHVILGQRRTGEEEVQRFPWEKVRRWKYSEPDRTFSFQFYFDHKVDKWIVLETEQEYVDELKKRMHAPGHHHEPEKAGEPHPEKPKASSQQPPPIVTTADPSPKPPAQTPRSPIESFVPHFTSKLIHLSQGSGSSKKVTENQDFNPTITDDDL